MPTEILKTPHMIEKIIQFRKGFRLNEGDDELRYKPPADCRVYPDRKEIRLRGLNAYVVTNHKLQHHKGELVLTCLAFQDPRSYKTLYISGRKFALENGTFNRRKIAKHLNTIFECPVDKMCRNISWRASNLLDTPGAFELMAHLDGFPLAGVESETTDGIDGKLYDFGGRLDAKYLPLIHELGSALAEMKEDFE